MNKDEARKLETDLIVSDYCDRLWRLAYERGKSERSVCEDAISKEWILKELNAESEKDYPSFRRITERIEGAPPVEPKRPEGEWLINPRIDAGRFEIKCSECGDVFIRSIGHMPNFCEYCGADMRGEENVER